jgi:hypothetical protein
MHVTVLMYITQPGAIIIFSENLILGSSIEITDKNSGKLVVFHKNEMISDAVSPADPDLCWDPVPDSLCCVPDALCPRCPARCPLMPPMPDFLVARFPRCQIPRRCF